VVAFTPYPKIPETTASWNLEEAALRKLNKREWVATEKLHGANMCVCVDGDIIQVAKRRGLLQPGVDFFDYRRALAPLLAKAKRLAASLATPLRLYGELVGGAYPHAGVDAIENLKPVQSGIFYSPDLHFLIFDVAVVTTTGSLKYLPFSRAQKLLSEHELPVVPIVARGKLPTLFELPTTFESHLPAQLGHPSLAGNEAEGLVLRPWDWSEASLGIDRRLLIKRKHPRFAESRFHDSKSWRADPIDDALEQAESILVRMTLDRNRVDSAISKVGRPIDQNDTHCIQALLEELKSDVLQTFLEHHGELVLSLSQEEGDLLKSIIEDAALDHIKGELGATFVLDPERYYCDLAYAFARGSLGPHIGERLPSDLHSLRLHKFKRKEGPPRVTRVLSLLEEVQPTNLLDIGSGRGAFLWPLLARFPQLQVTSLDRLPHRVNDIEAVRKGGVARVSAHLGDVRNLPFEDNEFDVVTILEVLEHLKDPAKAAQEVMRVAKHFVIASVPSREDNNPEHIQLFSEASLRSLCEDAGATRVTISYVLNHMIALVR
jgi:Rnl2 family RNA ligase